MLFGGYEPEPARRAGSTACRGSTAAAHLPADEERFAAADGRRGAALPVPRRRRRRHARLPSRRDDARRQPAARPDARRARLLDGRRPVAERLRRRRRHRQDHRRVDHVGRDRARRLRLPRLALRRRLPRPRLRRGGRPARSYRYYYRLRYPLDADEWGRPQRACARCTGGCRSRARCSRRRTAGSAPTTCGPGSPGAGPAPTSARSAGRRRRTSTGCADRAPRRSASAAGIIDMTSFGKIDVERAGRAGAARARLRQPHRPAGRAASSTRRCSNARGGILADVTVTRLADDRFRVVTGAGAVDADRGWLRSTPAATATRAVTIRDVQRRAGGDRPLGPARARRSCRPPADDDVSAAALRVPHRADDRASAPAPVLAQRITYVGELGFELYVAARAGPCRSGTGWSRPARSTGSSRRLPRRSSRCGWRRATATWAPT